MTDENKLSDLQKLLTAIEHNEEIVAVNLEELLKLIQENKITPQEFEKTFKKRFKDILA
jgi:rubrerythrin